jgi:hypothetical protein
VSDETGSLQDVGNDRHAGSLYPKHFRKILLGEI